MDYQILTDSLLHSPMSPSCSRNIGNTTALCTDEKHLFFSNCVGLKKSFSGEVLHYFFCIVFNVFYLIASEWFPNFYYGLRYNKSQILRDCPYLYIQDNRKRWNFARVEKLRQTADYEVKDGIIDDSPLVGSIMDIPVEERMVVFRNRRFLYNSENDMYELLHCDTTMKSSIIALRASGKGLTDDEHHENSRLFGRNIMSVPVPSLADCILKECLAPFFIFQIYTIILWYFEHYYIFAAVIAVMAIISVTVNIYDTRRNLTRLQQLARNDITVTVLRNDQRMSISSTELTIGDLVVLEDGIDIPCDMTMLSGSAVINEAMLTGESVPVVKYPVLDSAPLIPVDVPIGKDSRSTVFNGTTVMQLKPEAGKTDVLAMVVHTGFTTTKGNMISSMLYPPKTTFRFVQQSYKFLGFLLSLSLIGLGFTFWRYSVQGAAPSLMVLRALDLITIVVPPSLPLAMSIGVNFSVHVLSKMKIYCIDSSRITYAGKVKMMCFDKTGTLTADTLQFGGVHSFVPLNTSLPVTIEGDTDRSSSLNSENGHISAFTYDMNILPTAVRVCLSTCHSLATHKGNFVGDPLEIEGFNSANSNFQEASVKGVLFHTQLKRHCFKHLEPVEEIDDGSQDDDIVVEADEVATRIPDDSIFVHNDSNALQGMVYDMESDSYCQCDCHFYSMLTEEHAAIVCECDCGNGCSIISPRENLDLINSPSSYELANTHRHSNPDAVPVPLVRGGEVPVVTDLHGKPMRGCGDEGRYWSVVKQFPFESSLQRMGVIAINEADLSIHAFVKGAPEKIASLCQAETIPPQFNEVVDWYTRQGHRVIALAKKPLTINQLNSAGLEEEKKDDISNLSSTVDAVAQAFSTRDFEELRTYVESELEMLGLLILENSLKPATKPTIQKLKDAKIRIAMVTGDNVRTAVSVSKECGIVSPDTAIFVSRLNKKDGNVSDITWHHSENSKITLAPDTFEVCLPDDMSPSDIDFDKFELAVTGDVYSVLTKDHEAAIDCYAHLMPSDANLQQPLSRSSGMVDPGATSAASAIFEYPGLRDINIVTTLQRVALYGVVFSRFTPDQKASLINILNKLGIYTGMCGDGANDCGALKTAHVGISLAESEASIAAPFTSQIPDISAVTIVLAEGRSALTTSFLLFRFMSIFSFIQFFSVTLLYYYGGCPCDWQYLNQDLFIVFPIAIVMGNSPAARKLTTKRPSGNLLSMKNLLSILLHMITAGIGEWTVFYLTRFQTGYEVLPNVDHYCEMWEATSLQYFISLLYIIYAIICSINLEWKRGIFYNTGLCINIVLSTLFVLFCFLSDFRSVYFPFTYKDQWISMTWRYYIIGMVGVMAIVASTIEFILIPGFNHFVKKSLKKYRTNTVFGKGNSQYEKGAKPYHVMRRQFEDAWPQSQLLSIGCSSSDDESVSVPRLRRDVYARMPDQVDPSESLNY